MSIIQKFKDKIMKLQAQYKRGIEVTMQMQDEKRRKKFERGRLAEPGTLRYGLTFNQSIPDFFKDAYDRRKRWRREQNEKKEKKES